MSEFCRNVRLSLGCLALSACSLAFLSLPAKAGSIKPPKQLDFRSKTVNNTQEAGGTFSYTIGLGNKASVNNAPENSVIAYFTPKGPLAIDNGTLDFTTGMCIASCGEKTLGGYAASVPQFGQGGFLELRGSIPSLGIVDQILLYGSFVPFRGQTAVGMSLSGNPNVQSGMTAMLDVSTIDPALLAYYGFNPSFTGGTGLLSDMLLKLAFLSPTWNGEIASSDLMVDPALPEPPSLILFGSAMLLMAYLVRRKIGGSQGAQSVNQV